MKASYRFGLLLAGCAVALGIGMSSAFALPCCTPSDCDYCMENPGSTLACCRLVCPAPNCPER